LSAFKKTLKNELNCFMTTWVIANQKLEKRNRAAQGFEMVR